MLLIASIFSAGGCAGGGSSHLPVASVDRVGPTATAASGLGSTPIPSVHATTTSTPHGGVPTSASPTLPPLMPAAPAPVTTESPTSVPLTAPGMAPVQVRYLLPASLGGTTRMSSNLRRLQYISPSNTHMSIAVTPFGGGTTTYPTTACTTGSCVENFIAAVGPNTIVFTLTDNAAHILSTVSTVQIVQPIALNTLSFSANPVVNSVTLTLAAAPLPLGGTVVDVPLTVNALDIDGNIIAGTGSYVDATGLPLMLTLSVVNSQAGGTGNVTIKGQTQLTMPASTPIYAHYDGNWLDHSTIQVASSRAITGALTPATLTTVPHINQYAGLSGAATNEQITTGPDGNIWFTEYFANEIGRINLPAGTLTEFSVPGTQPDGIAVGPDGNLWFTQQGIPAIGKITPGGFISHYPIIDGSQPISIVAAPDGNLWFSESGNSEIGRITTRGVITQFPQPSLVNSGWRAMIIGPDKNIWLTNQYGPVVDISTRGQLLQTINAAAGEGITLGSDGNVWTASYNHNGVFKITPTGAVTYYAVGNTPVGIASGVDGELWVADQTANTIIRMTTAGVATVGYGNGISANAQPYAETVGPDNSIWFVEGNLAKIGRLVL